MSHKHDVRVKKIINHSLGSSTGVVVTNPRKRDSVGDEMYYRHVVAKGKDYFFDFFSTKFYRNKKSFIAKCQMISPPRKQSNIAGAHENQTEKSRYFLKI